MDEPRRRFAAMMSGLDVHYDLGEGHPLLGRRMPDLDLVTADGPLRVFALLHDARPVLLNLGEPGGFDIAPWADRVQVVEATFAGAWELPALGAVPAPTAVLIRPDGYVAWVGDRTHAGAHRRAHHLVRTAYRGVARRGIGAGRPGDAFAGPSPFYVFRRGAVCRSRQSPECSERRLMLIVPWKHVWSGDCVQLITLYSACACAPASDPSTTRPSSTAVPDWLS